MVRRRVAGGGGCSASRPTPLLLASYARFRSDIIAGVGGNQILVEDPSGNPVELFEPTRPEASL